ncbi:MAG TPA: response regulator transcription factor [Myxococcota bacterium]|nr:response regulator transcription factor [Myxococcota bacterium]
MASPEPRAPLRVLIVEDDPAMAMALRDGFAFEGHQVLHAADGAEGLALATQAAVDLVILDVMLPKLDGLEVCRQLRAAGREVPVIMLTARSQESDKVEGLRLGADDYVTKPFSFVELLARADAVLRRARRSGEPELQRFGDVAVDFRRLTATCGGVPLELSPREFAILACLCARRGDVVTREQLLQVVWGYETLPLTRTVDMHIAKLRRKIEPDPAEPSLIVTVHGVGYRLVPEGGRGSLGE